MMDRYVDVSFDCLPLRSISRMDIPLDASPKFRAKCERIKEALERHGSLNTYYLHNARCVFHVTNDPELGMLEFEFEGVVTTDDADERTRSADLQVQLVRETCDWLTEPIVAWFTDTVKQAVSADFNLYIAAGDLARTKERIAKMEAEMESRGGFLGMGL
ncbi:MAG: hypothetical protein J0M17_03315 [Planctomycetes bacterium]|nr:hypothetical protein [Planctomycetota bacterium]